MTTDQREDAVPDGYVLVPREPTGAMFAAARLWNSRVHALLARGVYEAMLAARPVVAAPQEATDARQEPVAWLQHSRDGVWLHLKEGTKNLSINLAADAFTHPFAVAYAANHPQNAKLNPLYAAPPAQDVELLRDAERWRMFAGDGDFHLKISDGTSWCFQSSKEEIIDSAIRAAEGEK